MNNIAKSFIVSLFLPFFIFFNASEGLAQNNKKEEATKKENRIQQIIESKKYAFYAQSVNPLRSSTRQLTPEYDVRIFGDSLVTYLPYFGRAYVAPINSSEGGIKFTSTQFDYKVQQRKKGGWEITINPKDNKDVRQLIFSVSPNGYAQLQVLNNNRDAISFNGYIDEVKGKK